MKFIRIRFLPVNISRPGIILSGTKPYKFAKAKVRPILSAIHQKGYDLQAGNKHNQEATTKR